MNDDGRDGAYPRCTHILDAVGLGPDLSRIPETVLEIARKRGTAVHALIEAEVYGYPPDEDDARLYAPYIGAYRRFVKESGFKAERAEFLVTHAAWRYIGHPDVLGWMGAVRMIVDVKTGDETGVGYQLALYRLAWNAEHPLEPVESVASLKLNEDGSYRFHEIESAGPEQVALAAVVVYHAQERT